MVLNPEICKKDSFRINHNHLRGVAKSCTLFFAKKYNRFHFLSAKNLPKFGSVAKAHKIIDCCLGKV